MRVGHGACEVTVIPQNSDMAEPAQWLDEFIRSIIPTDGFESVGHALRRLDKQGPATGSIELGSAEVWEAGGLEPVTLSGPERNLKEQVVVIVKN